VLKRVTLALILGVVLAAIVGAAAAFQDRGSIRGTVYEDRNRDGKCVGTGEPVLEGIPIKFVSDDGRYEVFLQSGSNGTYGLVAAGFGTWTVSAVPPTGYVVTSENPRKAFLGSEQLLVLGVDFCLAKGSAGTVLPRSGAVVAPALALAGFAGAGLFVFGVGLQWRRRRSA
jgi:hypothetical protein